MPGGEHRAHAAQDDDPDLVVGLGPQQRVVQLHEQPAVLRVPGFRSVQHDPGDQPVVDRLVEHESVVGHLASRGGTATWSRMTLLLDTANTSF